MPRPETIVGEKTQIRRESPFVCTFKVDARARYTLEYDLVHDGVERGDAAVADVTFVDDSAIAIPPPYHGFSVSKSFPAFRYLTCRLSGGGRPTPGALAFESPPGATFMEIRIRAWKAHFLTLSDPPRLLRQRSNEVIGRSLSPTSSLQSAKSNVPSEPSGAKGLELAGVAVDVRPGELLLLEFEVDGPSPDDRAGILTVAFRDDRFSLVPGPLPDLSTSERFGPYRYIACRSGIAGGHTVRELIHVPSGAVHASLKVRRWNLDIALPHGLSIRKVTWSEFASTLSPDSLTSAQLRRLVDQAMRLGDLSTAIRFSQLALRRDGRAQDAVRLRSLLGLKRELNTAWLPRITASAAMYRAQRSRILHLFKVIYPQESSGGAVRNWSVVRAQAATGLLPVVALSMSPDHASTALLPGNAAPDGVVEIEREGVLLTYPHFSAFRRKVIPADLMLEAEANFAAHVMCSHQCSLVHATSGFKGFDNALKGLALANHFQVPFVYEVRSFHEHTWSPLSEGVMNASLTKLRMEQEDRCMRAADAVVTISDAMMSNLRDRGISADKVHLVPNSVDDRFLTPADEAEVAHLRDRFRLHGKTVIGYVSNMSRREGHAVLLRAFARLVTEGRTDVVCLLVGNGPEFDVLHKLAEELGVGEKVIMPGELDHGIIKEVYSLVDVFVVPRIQDFASDYVTPMKPFEALAMGCRVIMSDRPVAREVLGKEERGLFFRTGDEEHLAQRIEETLTDQANASCRIASGRKWIHRERTWARNALRYAEIYGDLQGRHAQDL